MKYRFHVVCNDGYKDDYTVDSASERDFEINGLLELKEVIEITYCPILENGEFGERVKVL